MPAKTRQGSRRATKHEELIATFDRHLFISKDQSYAILSTKDGTQRGPVCKGNCQPSQFIQGLTYKFFGHWVAGKNAGERAFQFTVAVQEVGHSREAVVAYMSNLFRGHQTGIGEITASKIYDEFGPDSVVILRTNPAKVASVQSLHLTDEQCRKAAKILASVSQNESTRIELMDLFHGSGLYKSAIQQVIDLWGPLAPSVIRRDAFRLLTAGIKGAGFSRCDDLYLKLGGDPARIKRQFLAGWNAIRESMDGHTWYPDINIMNSIRRHIGGTDTNPSKAIALGLRSRWFSESRRGEVLIAERSADEAEDVIASLVNMMVRTPSRWPSASKLPGVVDDHQREQYSLATRGGAIAMLLGTPGTGKTFLAASLIQTLIGMVGEGAIAVCAPTGKAAVRLTEGLKRNGLTIRAKTIHRMLGITIEEEKDQAGWTGGKSGRWTTNFGQQKIEADVVICDETSMVDLILFSRLLKSLKPGTHLLLIGDPYQLPPVGQGAPLRDLIASGVVPYGELTEVKRNDGMIVRTCASIRNAAPWKGAVKLSDQDNLIIVPATKDSTVDVVRDLYEKLIAAGKRDPFDDVQVLVGLNKSREELNTVLQDIVNGDSPAHEGHKYRVGDKVICLANDAYPRAREDDDQRDPGKAGLSNGECGRVTAITEKFVTMQFDDLGDGDRVVSIPIKGDQLPCFDLAYAMTTHKSQGSEWPLVIIIADEAARMVASREWWYTAISRAKSRCIIVGNIGLIQNQCRRVITRDRRTLLAERIKEMSCQTEKSLTHLIGEDSLGSKSTTQWDL